MKQLPVNRESEQNLFFHNYSRLPIAPTHGEGVWLVGDDGTRYLDMIAGIGVNALGYGDSRLEGAIATQAKALIHASNLFMLRPQFELAAKLLELSGLSKVFFGKQRCRSNRGSHQNGQKMGRRKRQCGKNEVLSLSNCFTEELTAPCR